MLNDFDDTSASSGESAGPDSLPPLGAEARPFTSTDTLRGHVQLSDSADQAGDDLLDDIGESALKTGGRVAVVSSEPMPAKTGVAAIMRFQIRQTHHEDSDQHWTNGSLVADFSAGII